MRCEFCFASTHIIRFVYRIQNGSDVLAVTFIKCSRNYLLNWLLISLKLHQRIEHRQIASSIMHLKREALFRLRTYSVLNAFPNKCHNMRAYRRIAVRFSQNRKHFFLLLPSFSCTSFSPSSCFFTFLTWPLTPGPFLNPLYLHVPFCPWHLLNSKSPHLLVGSVFRPVSDMGNSWTNLQELRAPF